YVDTASSANLATAFNLILVVLVGIIFAVATIVTFFLSDSITRPIEKLCSFALGIGGGNFAANDFEFNDKELDELNTALNKSVTQLGAYDSAQKTFFQNVSHELRTPLMSIKCYAEGISVGIMEPGGASETILRETDKLSELVTDLLYVSKIDNITRGYRATNASVTEMLRACAERQMAMAEKRGLKFAFDFARSAEDARCECARELIARAIDNLISNAIRYAKSEIILGCRAGSGRVTISVCDDGSGIEPEVMPRLFERFSKGSDGNFGIGLSIVRSAAQLHGGSARAENLPGGGARFEMELPVAALA
ncbi:MAG: HAMP domain-containing histidine kinase, partial [Treponema sp.]|nr:HAMP domain-containing histidine kinase [Treponema sp.]